MERIPAYNWAGSLTSMTSKALVLALCHRLKGTFAVIRQNPAKGASSIEYYDEQTLALPPLTPEQGAIACGRSGVAPYLEPCLFIHTTAFALVAYPGDLIVLNPFFVRIIGLNGMMNRNPWIVAFLVEDADHRGLSLVDPAEVGEEKHDGRDQQYIIGMHQVFHSASERRQ